VPRHRLPLPGDHRHPGRGRGRDGRQPHHADPAADGRRTGRGVRPEAARPRPRPVLRAAQGAAAGGGPEGLSGLGDRSAPRRVPHPGEHPGRRLGREAAEGEDLPHRPLDPGRRGRLRRRARRAHQPAADGRLRLRGLRALHPPGAGGRGRPRRPLGGPEQDRVRTARMTMTSPSTNQENHVTTGATVWLTGLPSAGKTTIAHELAARLREQGRRVEVLDGDEIREFLSAGLGFSREDRHTNVQRIGFVAELLARNGVTALVPVIAPYADSRDAVRKRHAANGTPYVEVHVATPVEVCSVRDVKGLYAKQAASELTGLTGVDDPYEEPETPDLRIESQNQTVQESAASVYALLSERGLA